MESEDGWDVANRTQEFFIQSVDGIRLNFQP
jgi:hypothetical protein